MFCPSHRICINKMLELESIAADRSLVKARLHGKCVYVIVTSLNDPVRPLVKDRG